MAATWRGALLISFDSRRSLIDFVLSPSVMACCCAETEGVQHTGGVAESLRRKGRAQLFSLTLAGLAWQPLGFDGVPIKLTAGHRSPLQSVR